MNEGLRNSIPGSEKRKCECPEARENQARLQDQEEVSGMDTGLALSSGVRGSRQTKEGGRRESLLGCGDGLCLYTNTGGKQGRVLNKSVTWPVLFKAFFDYLWIGGGESCETQSWRLL